ncbi:DOMON-like domain-containing protein [Sphingomonas sp. CJ99]
MELVSHHDHPARAIDWVRVELGTRDDGCGLLEFRVGNAGRALLVPEATRPGRTEGLWRTTCFELFVRDGAAAYREFNFSPSSQWAAYRFAGYRAGMAELPLSQPPRIACRVDGEAFLMVAVIEAGILRSGARIALSAVIEEVDGTKSYWALAHPPGPPDFHHPDCFVLDLPAPSAS